jgi:hypothetical protein
MHTEGAQGGDPASAKDHVSERDAQPRSHPMGLLLSP